MVKKIGLLVIAVIFIFSNTPFSYAGELFGNVDEKPSVINYGLRGILIGSLAGASTGYLAYGEKDITHDKRREKIAVYTYVGMGVATVAGLGLGFYDCNGGGDGKGGVVLRDIGLGGMFGLVAGTAFGSCNAIKIADARHIPRDIAWGCVGGMVLGLLVGVIEAPKIIQALNRQDDGRFHMDLGVSRDSRNNLSPELAFLKRF